MQRKHLLFAGALALAALSPVPALAAPCAGFTDYEDTGQFCSSLEWVKNRGVTTGCTSTLYCPNDSVSRLQMAIFMRRLGEAMSPTFLRKRQTAVELGALNYTARQTVCVTDPFTIPATPAVGSPAFPRTAIISPLLNVFTADGGMDIEARVVYSVEPNPTVWQPVPDGDGYAYGAIYSAFTPPHDVSLRPLAAMNLNVGTTYRFAVQGIRTAGTGENANTYCENFVQIVNRNGTSAPFDARSNNLPPGRGM